MTKPKKYRGFVIAPEDGFFQIYTADEWAYGAGYRHAEHEAGSIEEAKEFIDDYEN